MDPAEFSFKMLKYIYNPYTDTSAFLAKKDGKVFLHFRVPIIRPKLGQYDFLILFQLIISFRGTKSMTNVKTNVLAIPFRISSALFSKVGLQHHSIVNHCSD